MEGPVDQIRLCDSDRDCPEKTRCLSDCNRYACVVQCVPSPENNRTSKNQQASSGKNQTKTRFT